MKKISTKGMSREEWLKIRKNTIGGSDAAAVVGLSRYSSPYSVWADKTGRLPDKEDSEAMRLGRDLEEYVAQRFCEAAGKKVRRENNILYGEKYPFAHADVDRVVVGEKALLECKTTNTLDLKQFRTGAFPEKYYVQCVHYLAVTGYERVYLAVLVFGRGFFTYCLERDEDEINALMAAEKDFVENYVKTDTAPPADGSEATSEALAVIYGENLNDETVDLFGREYLLKEYFALKETQDDIKKRMEEIKNTIKSDIKESCYGQCAGYKVSYKPQVRESFSRKAFENAYPTIDLAPFYSVSVSRVMRINEDKQEI